MEKKKSKTTLIIVLLSLAVIITGVTILVIMHFNKNHKVYTREDLEKIVGEELREWDGKYSTTPCMQYWLNGNVDSKFKNIEFYVFKDERTAQKVFKEIKSSWIYSVTDEGDNYIQGWLNGVCDASIEGYYYISGNMIVYTDIECVSCWGDAEEMREPTQADIDAAAKSKRDAEERVELITSTF